MIRMKTTLLAATLLSASAGGIAYAQQASTYDPAQLPETHGKVAQYSLTPRGDVDGLILNDGTEVHFPPHNSAELVFTVRPGDSVTIHGLKARATPTVMAMSITNDASHQTVTDAGPRGPREADAAQTEITGQVKAPLHGPRGEVNGVLLADGTEVRLPPPEAAKLGDVLAAGKPLVVRGVVIQNALGKLVMARQIGGDRNSLTTIAAPPPGGPMERMHHMMDHHGKRGPGEGADLPDGGPGAPPPPPPGSGPAPAPAQ